LQVLPDPLSPAVADLALVRPMAAIVASAILPKKSDEEIITILGL
jgi:hypothetical protein